VQVEKSKPGANEILSVAAKLFAERGYSNVSIRDVCREAGTTAPMIYYYFKDKKGLFRAAVSGKISLGQFIDRLRSTVEVPKVRDGVASFVAVYLGSFPDEAFDPGLYLRETAKIDDRSAEKISRQLDQVHRIAISLVRRGVKDGEFRQIDAEKASDCLIGMLNHVVFQKIHFSKSPDVHDLGDFITAFFLKAMQA
jgi:TetR/AcrR family transcriptional regulator, cholesterol catabolism regulator